MIKDLCFEITEKCPNHCKFCSSNSSIEKTCRISFEDFKRVIDYGMDHGGIQELSLSGGEPFFHPKLFDFVEYACNKKISTAIFTSGIKETPPLDEQTKEYFEKEKEKSLKEVIEHEPWNERLIKNITNYYAHILNPPKFSSISKSDFIKLRNLGLEKIVFDFQGYHEETDSYLMERDKNSFYALLDSIIHASLSGLIVDIHFVPMKPNYKEIKDILELIEIPKILNFSVLKFVPQGRGKMHQDTLELTLPELKEFLELLRNSKDIYNGKIRRSVPLEEDTSHKCTAGLEKINIKADGTILPCAAMKDLSKDSLKKYGIKIGNIYENLDMLNIPGTGTRVEPLCRKIYAKI